LRLTFLTQDPEHRSVVAVELDRHVRSEPLNKVVMPFHDLVLVKGRLVAVVKIYESRVARLTVGDICVALSGLPSSKTRPRKRTIHKSQTPVIFGAVVLFPKDIYESSAV
jgi:hypothetical protein